MLKNYFATQEEIPENLRGAYVLSDGKWILDALPNDHPVIQKREELLRENATQKGKITRLENEKVALEASNLPAGHVAVTTTDARLLEEIKPLGSAAEIKQKVQGYNDLNDKLESRDKQDALREIATENGYDPEKIAALEDRFPKPEFRQVEVDGKKEQRAYFKAGDVERSFTEFVENDPKLKPLQDSLKATGNGTRVHGTRSDTAAPSKDVFQRIREKAAQEQKQATTDLHPMFKKIPGRVVAPAGE